MASSIGVSPVQPKAKLCQKCGRDVAHTKRLKDAHGHYWCTDCGAPGDLSGSSISGLVSPCPRCHAPTHATQMIRKDGKYVCPACASGNGKRKRKRAAVYASTPDSAAAETADRLAAALHHGRADAAPDADRTRRMLVIVTVLLLAAAGAYHLLGGA